MRTTHAQPDGRREPGRHGVDLSVVIPAYGAENLGRCLRAVKRELEAVEGCVRAEIIVRDDAHPEGLPEELLARHPDVRFLFGEENLGFPGNANLAVEAARGRLLCLLNTDMYVDPGYFDDCLRAFEDPRVFAVCGRINEASGKNDGYKELVFDGSEVVLNTVTNDDPLSHRAAYVPYANGGGSFFRRSTFVELGGFDPVFAPYYWEDTDLGYRAWKRGYRILYDPRRSLVHDHQQTIGKHGSKTVRRIFRRNGRLFIWRNITALPLPRLIWKTTFKSAFRALMQLRLRQVWRLLSELRALPAVVQTRRTAYRRDRCSDRELARLWTEVPVRGRRPDAR